MVTTIEERLTQLERKNRKLTLALILTGVAAALVVTLGMARTETVPDVVKAHSFELLDENGKVRASLNVKDGPELYLRDENGKIRAGLALIKNAPELDLLDENGKIRARLEISNNVPGLDLLDENEKIRASLMVTKNGPGLGLLDENGRLLRHVR